MWYLFLLILGLVIGSFLGAFTYRYPRGKSNLSGRSVCPRCGEVIAWYDNIPLLSFFLLRGKCRRCRKKISLRYPLIELITALSFVGYGCFLQLQGPTLDKVGPLRLLFGLFIFSLLIFIFIIDWEMRIIPDEVIFLGLVATLFFLILTGSNFFFPSLLAGFLAADFLLLIHLATSGRGMGLGDVKFALLAGTILGPTLAIAWLFLAFLTGALVGVILILAGKAHLKSAIPFGPFLAVSLVATILWGERIFSLLLSL